MRLYCEGHSVSNGWAISRTWNDEECSSLPPALEDEMRPVRFVRSRERALKLVERWNRKFATH